MEATVWDLVNGTDAARITLDEDERARMDASADRFDQAIAADEPVYGVTRGFGPLVRFAADPDNAAQGLNLIHHLAAGLGPALAPDSTRLMLRLRIEGMKKGYSGIRPADWGNLARAFNAGFLPVVPAKGSVSASGDLLPLAHAALALAGHGEAWREQDGVLSTEPAADALARLGLPAMRWGAREALSFVNGSSASLAVALQNHATTLSLSRIGAMLTGQTVDLLGACTEPYADAVVRARGQLAGHARAARWIRDELAVDVAAGKARSVQEPYSLRCAPQIIGSVLDYLRSVEPLLLQEAHACSDNPVVAAEAVLHAGNFHAINAGVVSDLHAVLVHQLAFLAERQLALVLEPGTNGGLPALLAGSPGATSGLAGLQISATGLVAEIRQKSAPATTTALPTNLSNQDIVPMSLIGALRTREQGELAALVLAALAIAVAQIRHIRGVTPTAGLWADILRACPRLVTDRPLSAEVNTIRDLLLTWAAARGPDDRRITGTQRSRARTAVR
ncbi:aromatic amino acid lyase [Polymorphospora lycopeni]|uniref:Aromatic amino acid ammonia-lyase n=1 Tax=Polymorphospora lycopeni TaxID=3140240 RepID=A0ABV5CQF8_9ACTN